VIRNFFKEFFATVDIAVCCIPLLLHIPFLRESGLGSVDSRYQCVSSPAFAVICNLGLSPKSVFPANELLEQKLG
jgi:hypothetical protein